MYLNEKKQKLINVLSSYFTQFENKDEIVENIFEEFVDVTQPKIEIHSDRNSENNNMMGYITFFKGWDTRGVVSVKPGNILLNWKKLLIDSAESILTLYGLKSNPWLISLAGLIIWNRIYSLLNIKLSERHAVVIWVMWRNRDEYDSIENKCIKKYVNEELKNFKMKEMSEEELSEILNDLQKMKCIKKYGDKYRLVEKVKIEYNQ